MLADFDSVNCVVAPLDLFLRTEIESAVREVRLLDGRFITEVIEVLIESSLLEGRVDIETRDALVDRGLLDDSVLTVDAKEVIKLSSKAQSRWLYILEKDSV